MEDVRIEGGIPWDEPVKDGAEVARVFFGSGHRPPETTVNVEGKPSADILFGSGGLAMRLNTIKAMTEYAGLAVHSTRPLFAS